jgi:hypothetical protein
MSKPKWFGVGAAVGAMANAIIEIPLIPPL